MVERSHLLKIFMLIISVVLEIFHVFNFRETRVHMLDDHLELSLQSVVTL